MQVNGAGSTWVADRAPGVGGRRTRAGSRQLQAVGSTSGRVFYYQDQVDFAASEIPFTSAYRDSTGSVITNEVRSPSTARTPICPTSPVARRSCTTSTASTSNSTSRPMRWPRSSPASSPTGTIRGSRRAIRRSHLPNLPIRPVVRSDGSGTTAQFTAFMAAEEPAVYNAFCQKVGPRTPCPSVSLWSGINGQYRAGRLRRRGRLRRGAVQERCDHLRRVRLRQGSAASRSRRSSTRPGYLHAADRRSTWPSR